MIALGLDIGTTTISAVVTDAAGNVLDSITRTHDAFLKNTPAWERSQDPQLLWQTASDIVAELTSKFPAARIGVTGQQHGIVYLDSAGQILSPLYTWQDGRGNLPYKDSTYAAWLSQKTGYAMASGYGLVTHFYNLQNDLVPENAAVLTTIHDYVAMRLAGLTRPVTEPSDAQSLGFYDLQADGFDVQALTDCGIDPAILPEVRRTALIGATAEGIDVAVAIGDNPASFLGATGGADAVLLNVGTGSQISVRTDALTQIPGLETRPYPLGGFLLVGAALCGGRAWAMTEQFFSEAVLAFTGQKLSLYDQLNALLDQTPDDGTHPWIRTTFDGTRTDPDARGSVQGLSRENFTPGKFALGILHGMTDELYGMYRGYLDANLPPKQLLLGSGNGLRKNRHLQRISEETFRLPLTITDTPEEAAVGAATFARMI